MVSPIKIFSIIQEYNPSTIQPNQTIYLHLDLIIGMLSLVGITYTVPIFYRFIKYRIYYPITKLLNY
jgi:hypothetical protein